MTQVNSNASVDKSTDRVRQMFGQIAPRYDRLNHLLSMNVDRYWRWYTVRKLSPQTDADILDVCTGTGDLAFAFSRFTRQQASITAADFCPEMLKVGREKSIRRGLDSVVRFVEADAQNLPFENDAFDQVTVAFGLRNVEDTQQGLREMARVCRPQGKVGILEFSTPRRWPIKGIYGWYFRHVLPRIGQRLAKNDADAYTYLPNSVGEFPCYESLVEKMHEAGFSDVTYFPLTFGIATLYVGVK